MLRNHDYIKFVLSKVEYDFAEFSGSAEYASVITILHSLKSSPDILKEIYLLSGIKKLREFSNYMVFMFKKIEAGRINLDNFLENYIADKNFIESYLQTYYNLESSAADTAEEEKEVFLFNESENDIGGNTYALAEADFKVEEIDNELVSEEFRETRLLEMYDISESRYMELVQNDGGEVTPVPDNASGQIPESEDVFDLPTNKPKETNPPESVEKVYEESVSMNDADEIAAEENKTLEAETIKEETQKISGEEKQEPHDLDSFFEEVKKEPGTVEEIQNTKKEITPMQPGESVTEEVFETETPPAADVTQEEINYTVPADIPAETDEQKIIESAEEEDNAPPIDEELDKTLKEIEQETTEEINNTEFIKFEKEMYEKNRTLNGLFDDLILILDSAEQDYEMKNAITEEIFAISATMKECSVKFSFEIISKVYACLIFCLDKKFREISVTKENIETFRHALAGVEKLVKGENLAGFEQTIKSLDELENDLNDLLAKREEFERKKFDFGEEERKIIEEFTDSGEREAYLALRQRIIDTEEIFASITSVKERIAPFEVLRRLSSSFAQFREIVNIARILEMHKMAQLAEASYIFVKFLQNYRMDPYQKEVSEVLQYIVYCSKLIYLDKPVKDLETFVSYLNDPVKIFHTNTKDKNE